ncbi:MAG: hypothetical protein Fues2KO_04400 [Fuerstiella sp.]
MKIARWGFKKEAHDYAREFRAELNLRADAPLCPWKLAQHLEIPVTPISTLENEAPEAVRFLMNGGSSEFFGVTYSEGSRRFILHNDANKLTRQRSDLAHELGHAILGHPPSPPFNKHGERNLDDELEKEATFLGGALLVSEEATLRIVRTGAELHVAATEFGVSKKLVQMRINLTGARNRVRRRSRR